ncbi:MAG: 2,3-bisphosphoglycerate-independent phosphoglycerate mutase [Oscillospiraceae bacterium]|nr:2,3-bisphosphoglycerate-independent phosphoglycerate mutase [Oscillospiraceae bacterium]
MKYILVIGDGMADNPVPFLGDKTPMQVADTPCMDRLAAQGEVGQVRTVPVEVPPGSDTAILSIFGADPRVCYTGRSPLEAAGSGITLQPGDVSYRCNMVTYEDGDQPFLEKKILSHNAGSIEGEESIAIITALFSHPEFAHMAEAAGMRVYPSPSFRHIAVQKGASIDGLVAAPPHDHLGEVIGPLMPTGCENAAVLQALMEKAHEILDHHPLNEARRQAGKRPANGIWFWAEGTGVALDSFVEKYHKKGVVISAVPLCHGIARLTGLDVQFVEGATGELETNYQGKVDAAVQALMGEYDFAAVHIEAPDECTHNGDTEGKIEAITRLDHLVVRPLTEAMEQAGIPYRLLILSDHKTLTSTRGHDGDPVPFLLYESGRDTGAGLPYDEASGEQGRFLEEGTSLMDILFQTDQK